MSTAKKTCEQCGQNFAPDPRAKGRFCSRDCWRRHEASLKPTAICPCCKQEFRIMPYLLADGKPRFCSRACDAKSRTSRPIADRFWDKVQKCEGEGCWLWTGTRDKNGYGRIATKRGQNPMLATRLSYELAYGPFDQSLDALHRCDNPPCVRPDHLFLGDQKANMDDCSAKGRTTRGERSATARLTDGMVREIRLKYDGTRGILVKLAKEYDVRWQTIADVVHRRTWTHIND